MSIAAAIAALPDEAKISLTIGNGDLTVGELKAALSETVVYITTEQAAERFTYTQEWWAKEAPQIDGAFKDRTWHLPLRACARHLANRGKRTQRKRTPWGATPQASHLRAAARKAG